MIRALLVCAATLAPGMAAAQSVAERLNDYPTEARADYVFGCMAANGQSRQALRQCSCSIDEIASILPRLATRGPAPPGAGRSPPSELIPLSLRPRRKCIVSKALRVVGTDGTRSSSVS